jgi:hypothetical protein
VVLGAHGVLLTRLAALFLEAGHDLGGLASGAGAAGRAIARGDRSTGLLSVLVALDLAQDTSCILDERSLHGLDGLAGDVHHLLVVYEGIGNVVHAGGSVALHTGTVVLHVIEKTVGVGEGGLLDHAIAKTPVVGEGISCSGRVVGVKWIVQGGFELRGTGGIVIEGGVVRLLCILLVIRQASGNWHTYRS